jgi:hypothetical protein
MDYDAPKQVSIRCPPLTGGPHVLLLGFTGLAQSPSGTPMLQWIRETIRVESRPIMPLLDHLRDRLTRDIGRTHLGRHLLVLTGGIFEGTRRYHVEMNNVDPVSRSPSRQFRHGVFEVTEPALFLGGLGQRAVLDSDRDLIVQQPRSWRAHLELLASVNRRAAEKDRALDSNGVGCVSPWCQASYLAQDEDGAHGQEFRDPADPPYELGVEFVLAGIDFTESTRVLLERARGSALTDQDLDDAIRRGLKEGP